jgi:hypothetical protein
VGKVGQEDRSYVHADSMSCQRAPIFEFCLASAAPSCSSTTESTDKILVVDCVVGCLECCFRRFYSLEFAGFPMWVYWGFGYIILVAKLGIWFGLPVSQWCHVEVE